MNKSIVMILVGAGMALSLPSWGHSDDYLDTLATPHGGQLRMAGPYHLELVTKDKELVIYVTDHGDNPIKTEGEQVRQRCNLARERLGPRSSLNLMGRIR